MRGSSQVGPYEEIALIHARDGYGNWVTHYEDKEASTGVWVSSAVSQILRRHRDNDRVGGGLYPLKRARRLTP